MVSAKYGKALYLFYRTSKIFIGKIHNGHLLVPGQVLTFAIA